MAIFPKLSPVARGTPGTTKNRCYINMVIFQKLLPTTICNLGATEVITFTHQSSPIPQISQNFGTTDLLTYWLTEFPHQSSPSIKFYKILGQLTKWISTPTNFTKFRDNRLTTFPHQWLPSFNPMPGSGAAKTICRPDGYAKGKNLPENGQNFD